MTISYDTVIIHETYIKPIWSFLIVLYFIFKLVINYLPHIKKQLFMIRMWDSTNNSFETVNLSQLLQLLYFVKIYTL